MLTRQLGLASSILGANVRSPELPYKVTFVATYHCNFRCEMCNIWQKESVNEMTPDEVGLFFERWSQFSWVHLTGGELFMRRDLDDLVAAIQKSCRSLFLLNFPTTGWFGDKTMSLVERTLDGAEVLAINELHDEEVLAVVAEPDIEEIVRRIYVGV